VQFKRNDAPAVEQNGSRQTTAHPTLSPQFSQSLARER
jgi:hypothetical protein